MTKLTHNSFFQAYKRTITLVAIFVFALAIPVTVSLVSQQQDLRQRAASNVITTNPAITSTVPNCNSIVVTWSHAQPLAQVDFYKVEYRLKGATSNTPSANLPKNSTSYTISNLQADREYIVRIRAWDINGGYVLSADRTVKTTPSCSGGGGNLTIAGVVFNDTDGDGTKDTNESNYQNTLIRIELIPQQASELRTETSLSNGAYSFTNLVAANYQLRIKNIPANYSATNSTTRAIPLSQNQNNVNFGVKSNTSGDGEQYTIRGIVYKESAPNTCYGTTPAPGVDVYTHKPPLKSIAARGTTGADGRFTLTVGSSGTYAVTVPTSNPCTENPQEINVPMQASKVPQLVFYVPSNVGGEGPACQVCQPNDPDAGFAFCAPTGQGENKPAACTQAGGTVPTCDFPVFGLTNAWEYGGKSTCGGSLQCYYCPPPPDITCPQGYKADYAYGGGGWRCVANGGGGNPTCDNSERDGSTCSQDCECQSNFCSLAGVCQSNQCTQQTNRPLTCDCSNNSQCAPGLVCSGGKCSNPPTTTPTNTPTNTPTPTSGGPVNTPTNTPTGRPTNTPTNTPTTQPTGEAKLALSVKLPGIGNEPGDNSSPGRQSREVEVAAFDVNNNEVKATTGTLSYTQGIFSGTISLGTGLVAGPYNVRVRFDNTLWKLVPLIVTITPGQTTIVPQITLIGGDIDINQDNRLDLADWNVITSCFESPGCGRSVVSDLNDDGQVEEIDVNIILRGFAIREGD